jgi:hypothetical protein
MKSRAVFLCALFWNAELGSHSSDYEEKAVFSFVLSSGMQS